MTPTLHVAGGTGVSFTLPLAEHVVTSVAGEKRDIDFVWVTRRAENLVWVKAELLELERKVPGVELVIRVFVTRNSVGDLSTGDEGGVVVGATTSWLGNHHPSCRDIVRGFCDDCVGGGIQVLGSGPQGLGGDLREAV